MRAFSFFPFSGVYDTDDCFFHCGLYLTLVIDLIKKYLSGDGNCLFKPVFFLYNTEDRFNEVRLGALNEIVHEWDFYTDFFLRLTVDKYRYLMYQDREYGTASE